MTLTATITTKSPQANHDASVKQIVVKLADGANALAALVAAKQIQVVRIVLTTDTAGTFKLNSGSDVLAYYNLTANGVLNEVSPSPDAPLFCGSTGAAISMTVSGTPTNAYCYLQYREL